MKKIRPMFHKTLAAFAVLSLCLSNPGTAQAVEATEQVTSFGNSVLDGIENFAISSGVVDLKKKVWNDYGLLLKPYLKSRYTLTSNVFKAPDTDSDHTDNVWSFTPGLQFLHKNEYGIIGGAYEATFNYFQQFSEQNAQNQKFLIYANLFPTENTYVRISENLVDEAETAGSSAFDTIDHTDNTASVVAGYILGKFTFEAGYENFNRDFRSAVAHHFSYNENKLDYRIYYQVNDEIKVYSGVRLGHLDYFKNVGRNTFYTEVPVGVQAKLPFDVMANASVGIHHRNLEVHARNDLTTVVTNISLQKSFNQDKTSLELGFLRRPVESTFATTTVFIEKMWYTSVKHLFTEKLRGRLNLYYANRDWRDRVFTGTRVVVGGAVFVLAGSPVVQRDDDAFGVDIGFDYNVRKWLIMHIDYQYSRRNSNISQLDYTENAFSLGSTIPL